MKMSLHPSHTVTYDRPLIPYLVVQLNQALLEVSVPLLLMAQGLDLVQISWLK